MAPLSIFPREYFLKIFCFYLIAVGLAQSTVPYKISSIYVRRAKPQRAYMKGGVSYSEERF